MCIINFIQISVIYQFVISVISMLMLSRKVLVFMCKGVTKETQS